MMLDANVVAASPSSVYRVLSQAGVLSPFLCDTFYFMYSILDGCSLAIVHWEIREKMQEVDIETIVKRGLEKYPNSRPRVITDNGPQFISRDFKGFIRIAGMTHVKTWSYHPQSNGKIERYHRTIKGDCIRAKSMTSVDDVRQAVTQYVHHYNTIRLHSAIGYVTPHTKLAGKEKELFAQRDEKLEAARERRRLRRTEAIQNVA
jgi:putative transposase